jgi:hypothetical protein
MSATCHLTVAELRPWGLQRLWSAEAGIFLGLWLALLCFGRTELFRDPGVFWHTATGERMLDQGQIVRSDPYSFTFPGQSWVDNQWLADCGMAWIYRDGGWDSLLLATATVLAAVYAGLAGRLLRAGLHVLPALLVVGLALAASSQNFHVRPLVVTIALQGWMFARLVDVEAGRRPIRSLAWLVPVFVLWQNCHGGVLAGLGTLGLVFLGWSMNFLLRGRATITHLSPRGRGAGGEGARFARILNCPIRCWRDMAVLATILAASLAGVLLNPYGLDLPRSWLKVLSLPLGQLIQEHAPLDLRQPFGLLAAVLGLGYLAALVGVWPRRPRITWLIPLLWFVLAAQRVRNAPLAAIVTVIAMADLLPHTRWTRWLSAHDLWKGPTTRVSDSASPGLLSRVALPAMAVLVAVAILFSGPGWVRLDSARWPVALLPELRAIEDQAGGDGRPIFNDMLFGGFLIFHTPRLPIFIDDRCEQYGRDFLLAYDRCRRQDPRQIEAWRRQYHFDLALVESGSPLDRYLDSNGRWTLVRRSGPAALWRVTNGE